MDFKYEKSNYLDKNITTLINLMLYLQNINLNLNQEKIKRWKKDFKTLENYLRLFKSENIVVFILL